MDIVQFKEFLAQLVSLQAAGLDAQHLIDEADRGGYERGLKEASAKDPVLAPVEGGEVVAPLPGQIVLTEEELSLKLAEAKQVGIDEAIANDKTKFNDEDVALAVAESKEASKKIIADLELKLAEKDADALEEAIADQLAEFAQKLRDRTVKPAPVIEEPVIEPAPEVQV